MLFVANARPLGFAWKNRSMMTGLRRRAKFAYAVCSQQVNNRLHLLPRVCGQIRRDNLLLSAGIEVGWIKPTLEGITQRRP
ncbi:MAG: hypothetical protein ACR2RB_10050, partial [Gammaproteobacteria bacterium]